MDKCTCGGNRKQLLSMMPDKIPYQYWQCARCGEETLDCKQLHAVAQRYRGIYKRLKTLDKEDKMSMKDKLISEAVMRASEQVLQKDWDNEADERWND